MIKYTTGNLFTSGADCLINTVNCEGYMGKGVAYQFKQQFPKNNLSYIEACKNGSLHPGTVHTFVEKGITIINFPTKGKWRGNSRMSYVSDGLDDLVRVLPSLGVHTVAMPPLGCGNGGLDWQDVKPVIEEKLHPIEDDFTFLIYEPTSYNKGTVRPPELSMRHLIILQLFIGLSDRSRLRLQECAYFMNLHLQKSFFTFKLQGSVPYAPEINQLIEEIGRYQKAYGLTDAKDTYQKAYEVTCSTKTDQTIKRLTPAINKALEYTNAIPNDHMLAGIAAILYMIQNTEDITDAELSKAYIKEAGKEGRQFLTNEIADYTNYLEKTGMIEKDLFGSYHLSSYLVS